MPTLDLLVISEPPDIGSWFAARCAAHQGDYVPLHGRLGESCDLWSSWHSCGSWNYNYKLQGHSQSADFRQGTP